MRAPLLLLGVLLVSCAQAPSQAVTPAAPDEPPAAHQIVSLLAYVEKDYSGAVKDGVVVSEFEYEEQKAFIKDMIEISRQLPGEVELPGDEGVAERLGEVGKLVEAKAKEGEVAASCAALKSDIVKSFDLTLSPDQPPAPGRGVVLYAAMCADCHGKDGRAETPRKKEMEVPPASFFDDEIMGPLSPYRAYEIMSFGVGDMPSFELVPVEDRWALAYYIFELRHVDQKVSPAELAKIPAGVPRTPGMLAKTTDGELLRQLGAAGLDEAARRKTLAALRVVAPYTSQSEAEALAETRELLAEAVEKYEEGDADGAYDAALRSYLGGFEGVEMRLRARDNTLVDEVEGASLRLRASIRGGAPLEEVSSIAVELRGLIDRAEGILIGTGSGTTFAFLASVVILLREGVEAALVITAILALLTKLGRQDARKYVHGGWLLALVFGAASFVVVQELIALSATSRDLMEGAITLLAAAVMFFTSYWLISRAEAQRWVAFLRRNVEGKLSGGNLFALSGLAFLAVFREALETMLFYQALLLDPSADTAAVAGGMAVGAAALALTIWALLTLGKKIPLQRFFGVSGAFLYAMAVIFAGAGLHELQEVSYAPAWPVPFVRIDFLGIYPDALTLGVQGLLVAAAGVAFLLPYLKRRDAVAPQA
jgi:high-affinity iron transporter